MNAHPDLTLLLRDEPSLRIARNEFRARSLLCPDAAFALWPLRRAGEPDLDVVWLHRTDHESAAAAPERAPAGRTTADWVAEPKGRAGLVRRPLRRLNRRRGGPVQEAVVIGALNDLLARQRVEFGRRLLSRARVVVSDRLHAHVFSLLLGIPHVVLNDRYDKLRSFYETWSRGLDLARFADSPRAAVEGVRTLLGARPAASLAGRASTSSP
jgi:exopolysaccharide biosynthesis predicted pyruvyltransferase EpsI